MQPSSERVPIEVSTDLQKRSILAERFAHFEAHLYRFNAFNCIGCGANAIFLDKSLAIESIKTINFINN